MYTTSDVAPHPYIVYGAWSMRLSHRKIGERNPIRKGSFLLFISHVPVQQLMAHSLEDASTKMLFTLSSCLS
jgi:hypothetical protein